MDDEVAVQTTISNLSRSQRLRQIVYAIVEALGITTMCMLWVVAPLVNGSHHFIYHWSGQPWMAYLPVIIDFVAVWVLLSVVLLLALRHSRLQLYLWTGVACLMPCVIVKDCGAILERQLPYHLPDVLLAASLIAFVSLVTLGHRFAQTHFQQLHRAMSVLLRSAGVTGAVLLCQLVWFAGQASELKWTLSQPHPIQAAGLQSKRPRVIWIVLDELSYDQVYGRRFTGLKLPAFDLFAAQATDFTNVVPAGVNTEKIMPALLLGEPVDNIRSSAAGNLSVHNPSNGWKAFNQQDNVFADAVTYGYRTAIDGWYNPYCRLMSSALDRCYWEFMMPMSNHTSAGFSLLQNIAAPFKSIDSAGGTLHVYDYQQLSAHADQMLQDPSLNFVLLHMPVPHPGGIYDRRTGRFKTSGTNYLDNLALADQFLAHVRTLLEAQGEWDASTVIIMGDHSWRTKLEWEKSSGWTEEEQRASHGGEFDDRPAYIVKLPQQHQAAQIDTRFAATRTRALLDNILDAHIQTPQQLSAWAK